MSHLYQVKWARAMSHLCQVVGPRRELEHTHLLVERKQRHVELTRTAQARCTRPEHTAVGVYDGVGRRVAR